MTIHYHCRYCKTEVGTLPFHKEETLHKLHRLEIGEIDDFIEKDAEGRMTVQCICEQCEQALRRYPDYHILKRWLQ